MKTKFLAGLVATIVSFLFVVGLAIVMVVVFDLDESSGTTKIVAFAAIGIWVGLYSWLKPKTQEPIQNESSKVGEAKQENTSAETKEHRNSYH